MESKRTHNGGVGVGVLQGCEPEILVVGAHGVPRLMTTRYVRVLLNSIGDNSSCESAVKWNTKRTNNLIMKSKRTHNGGVGVGALQGCEPGILIEFVSCLTSKRAQRKDVVTCNTGLGVNRSWSPPNLLVDVLMPYGLCELLFWCFLLSDKKSQRERNKSNSFRRLSVSSRHKADGPGNMDLLS
ncbi:hypothetical protein F2Q69_00061074 [Brassica cretica]|uniref:Uncharacterized protein n=1 Tax=Brassica cretica TaxID=69181 RepID=A0A8S9RM81_BRACR|nr:hypothetical protein F2Q69_00061074 [Brassica cretica]